MANFPAAGYLSNVGRTNADMKVAMEDELAATKQIPGAGVAESTLTIAAGVITPTGGVHAVDTEAAAVADDLATIAGTNLPDGSFLWLRSVSAARVVTVKHAAGQIALKAAADLALTSPLLWLVLKRTGAGWEELAQFAPPAAPVSVDVRCHLRLSANVNVPNNGGNTVALDTELVDTHGMHDNTNPTRITITAGAGAGRYLVIGQTTWNVETNGGMKSGGVLHTHSGVGTMLGESQIISAPSANDYAHCNASGVADCAVGDYFELFANQRTSATLALVGGAIGSGDAKTSLMVVKLN